MVITLVAGTSGGGGGAPGGENGGCGTGGSAGGGNGGGAGLTDAHRHALYEWCGRLQTQPPNVLVSIELHDSWNCGKLVVRKARLPLAVW